MPVFKNEEKINEHIDSILDLASKTEGMGVSLYKEKINIDQFNCQAWSHSYISQNKELVKSELIKQLMRFVYAGSTDVQLLIINEDESAKQIINYLLIPDHEITLLSGLKNSKIDCKPNFILSVQTAVDGRNYSKSYNSIRDVLNRSNPYFIKDDNKLKGDVRVYSITSLTDLAMYI